MGQLVDLITPYHKRTQRDYLARMNDDKVHCMEVARQYGQEYWDGERRYGYGGYKYIPGYWKPLAEQLIAQYGLTNDSWVLDVGCGKGHLLNELSLLLPELRFTGFDVSAYGLATAPPGVQSRLFIAAAEHMNQQPIRDNAFDLVLAMGSLHNLKNFERATALREIERVGKQAYLWVESYRNAREQFNLECWALTCWAFQTPEEWLYEFQQVGYTGDYEFIFFE